MSIESNVSSDHAKLVLLGHYGDNSFNRRRYPRDWWCSETPFYFLTSHVKVLRIYAFLPVGFVAVMVAGAPGVVALLIKDL